MIRMLTIDNPEWDEIVGKVYGSYAHCRKKYIQAISRMDKAEPILFFYEDDMGAAVSVYMKYDIAHNRFFEHRIPENKYYDLISPYGYGGYVVNGCNPEDVADEHREFCKSSGSIVSEVVKFHPLSKFVDSYKGRIDTPFHNVIRPTDGDIEDIWMDFKQKVRKNVKKAQNSGLVVFHESNNDHLPDFINVYYKTMERTNAREEFFFDKRFFDILGSNEKNIRYFYAEKDGKVISVELVLFDEICSYSFLGGTDEEYFDMRPNDLLKYEIIKWSNLIGLKYFILGGGHGDDDGIFRYKEALSPKGVVDFHIGMDLFNEVKYKELCDIRKENDKEFEISTRFFPEYRF